MPQQSLFRRNNERPHDRPEVLKLRSELRARVESRAFRNNLGVEEFLKDMCLQYDGNGDRKLSRNELNRMFSEALDWKLPFHAIESIMNAYKSPGGQSGFLLFGDLTDQVVSDSRSCGHNKTPRNAGSLDWGPDSYFARDSRPFKLWLQRLYKMAIERKQNPHEDIKAVLLRMFRQWDNDSNGVLTNNEFVVLVKKHMEMDMSPGQVRG